MAAPEDRVSGPPGALARYRVVDLTRVRAGPTAIKQLADWGADVLQIEVPEEIDSAEPIGGLRHASDFQNLHRNKRAMTLNFKHPEGKAILLRLVRDADVVAENFRPDVKYRLGIDYDSLAALNPRLVYASISGFGQDGPYAARPGVDQVAQGMGGIMSITGKPGDGPMRVGVPLADLTAGLLCATGILIALLERESSGRGQWVQTSLLEAQIQLLDQQAARWLADGVVPAQSGNDHPTSMPTSLYQTKDGAINIGGSGGSIFARLAAALGMTDLDKRPEFSSEALRSQNRRDLDAVIAPVIRQRTSAEWIEELNAAGVPAGPVYDVRQVFDDPQVRHLGMAAEVDHPTLGRQHLVGQAIRMTRTPWRIHSAAPDRGQHTDEVLEALGYDAAERDRLRREGAI